MKLRNGFVSNSSSSSFCVVFPHKPENSADVEKMVFQGCPIFIGPFDDLVWGAETVAATLWGIIQRQKPATFYKIKKELLTGHYPGQPDYYDFALSGEICGIDWDAFEAENKRVASRIASHFHLMGKGRVHIFEFSDNDGGYYAALEHGDLFSKLYHIKIDKH